MEAMQRQPYTFDTAALLDEARPINILVVDDNRIDLAFLQEQIKTLGHNSVQATNGEEAIMTLRGMKDQVDVILMDREMPFMDGLKAIRRIKDDRDLRKIPIIMVSSADQKNDITAGIDAGVFYYLTKPVDEDMLRSVLNAAKREMQKIKILGGELKRHKNSFNLIHTCKFNFSALEEAESLAAFIANCFPDPERAFPGLAELMINAVEHGNLGIGYEYKTALVDNGTWRAEVERRQSLEDYKDKAAEIVVNRKDGGIYVVINDDGPGFEWKRYLTIDPARAGDNHGRGIAQAKTVSFDKLTYNEKGNQVVAFAHDIPTLEW